MLVIHSCLNVYISSPTVPNCRKMSGTRVRNPTAVLPVFSVSETHYTVSFKFCIGLQKVSLACVTQNLEEPASKQLFALVSSKSSSACTLATHVTGNREFGPTLWLLLVIVGTAGLGFLLFVKSTWTANKEYTGLWSENLDSPLKYHICLSPSPFHRILSHLQVASNPRLASQQCYSLKLVVPHLHIGVVNHISNSRTV